MNSGEPVPQARTYRPVGQPGTARWTSMNRRSSVPEQRIPGNQHQGYLVVRVCKSSPISRQQEGYGHVKGIAAMRHFGEINRKGSLSLGSRPERASLVKPWKAIVSIRSAIQFSGDLMGGCLSWPVVDGYECFREMSHQYPEPQFPWDAYWWHPATA